MLLATTSDNRRILPTRDEAGFCPACGGRVTPRLGQIRVHHWAHAPSSDCSYGRGMTEWHYHWILRHHNRDGWLIEHTHGSFRFDCFHPDKGLVLEFQNAPIFEYMYDKTRYCRANGFRIHWILNRKIFQNFILNDYVLEAPTRRRLAILDAIDYCTAYLHCADFYVDLIRSRGAKDDGGYRLSKVPEGLYKLTPILHADHEIRWPEYYRLKLEKHTRRS